MAGRTPGLQVTINSVTYPCHAWQTAQVGELLREEWLDGFIGGMGDYTRSARDTYYIAKNMDGSMFPYMRLRPTDFGGPFTLSNLDMSLPIYAFIITEGTQPVTTLPGTKYIYVINGRYGYKFSADGSTNYGSGSGNSHKDFGASAVCGHPAFFEGFWHIPLGASVDPVRLTVVAATTSADTFAAISTATDTIPNSRALHFAGPFNHDGTATIARAHSINNVDLSTDTTQTNGGFAADFEVGDSGIPISELLVWQNELAVVKPDNIYQMDGNGNAYPIQSFVSQPQLSKTSGSNSHTHGSYLYTPIGGRLWRMVGSSAKPIDPTADPRWSNISLVVAGETITPLSAVGNYAYGAVCAFGQWLYWSTGLSIFYGQIQEDGSVRWHGSLYTITANGPLRVQVVGARSDGTVPMLVVSDSTGSTKLRFFALANDGSPRSDAAGNYRGAASENAMVILPKIDFGHRDRLKQLRRMYVMGTELADTGVELELGVITDENTSNAQVGTDVTTDGYSERTWTPGTSDTARWLHPVITIKTGAGYVGTTGDPRVHAFGIEAATASIYRCEIPVSVEGLNPGGQSMATVMQALRNLRNATTTMNVADPYQSQYSMDTFPAQIVGIEERALTPDDGYGQGYMMTLLVSRFEYGS